MKWKRFVLLLLFVGLVGGCMAAWQATEMVMTGKTPDRTHEQLMQNLTYRLAVPEVREKILAKRIGIGMTINECKLAWEFSYFQCLRKDSLGYELWRVHGGSSGYIYLHVENGNVEYTANYPDLFPR